MQDFYGASAGKSWLTVVNCSSHTEFLDAGAILDKIIAGLCGTRGSNSFQVLSACHILGKRFSMSGSGSVRLNRESCGVTGLCITM